MEIGQLLQAPDPMALYEALQARDNQFNKTQTYKNMSQANYGAAGTLGIIGNLFGGIMAKRNRKKSDGADKDFAQKQGVYNQELAAFKAQQEQAKAKQERALRLEDEARKRGYTVEDRNYNADQQNNRISQSQGFQHNENQLSRDATQSRFEQQQSNAAKKQSLTPMQKKVIPLVESGQMSKEEASQLILNDARGTKELSDTAKSKLSFIRNSMKKIAQYKKEAFHDGDYQEIGSKFGNTNNLLVEGIRNKLRAESGAEISDQEAESETALFEPSMFRSDETNLSKINELEETLKTFESEILGNNSRQVEKTGQIMIDANGNKAMVYPDGSFKEL